MNYFEYRNDQLHAEDVPIADLARRINTPFFVYSARTLRRHFRVFDEAFAGTDHLICYAMKALSNLSILKLFASMGAGFDIVSVGELMRCLRVGADPRKIVFSGVGKSDEEIEAALKGGILMMNVESLSQVDEYYAEASALAQLEIVGLSTHIGSQITEMAPFAEAGQKVAAIVGRLRKANIQLKYLDLGGGLGIPYQEQPPPPSEYAHALLKPIAGLGLKIITEPGRVIVGNAGVLVTRVLYNKETDVKRFVVIDAAMNDLIRPVLYEAYHSIIPVDRRKPGKTVTADI